MMVHSRFPISLENLSFLSSRQEGSYKLMAIDDLIPFLSVQVWPILYNAVFIGK